MPKPRKDGQPKESGRPRTVFGVGGSCLTSAGYVRTYAPFHPTANKYGSVHEHRRAVEVHLGRPLSKDEHVHHINGDKTDNRIENLEVLTSQEHWKRHGHNVGVSFKIAGVSYKECSSCHEVLAVTSEYYHMRKNGNGTATGSCKPCWREKNKARWQEKTKTLQT